jgi:hypothetical protein
MVTEFLRSFRPRAEIIKEEDSNNNNNTTDIASLSLSLVPPFQTIGFLESKWLEMIKELVEHGNNNLLGNFKLYLDIRVCFTPSTLWR